LFAPIHTEICLFVCSYSSTDILYISVVLLIQFGEKGENLK